MLRNGKRFRRVMRLVVGVAALAVSMAAINAIVLDDPLLETVSTLALVFVGNMALTIPARSAVRQAHGTSARARVCVAVALVAGSLVLLALDYVVVDTALGDISLELALPLGFLLDALVWIGAFVAAWRPFIVREENRYIAACMSLALGTVSMVLLFVGLFRQSLSGPSSYVTSDIGFMLSCVSFATAISTFMAQRDARTRQHASKNLGAGDDEKVVVRALRPRADFSDAKALVAEGMYLGSYASNELDAWASGRSVAQEAIAGSTHLYGAYLHGRLAGFLAADMHGQPKPYAHSVFALCHRLSERVGRLLHQGGAADAFDEATRSMSDGLAPRPDAELLYLVSDQSLTGMHIEEALFTAFKRDFAGHLVYLCTDGTDEDDACTQHGFELVSTRTIPARGILGDENVTCAVYVEEL